MMDSDKGMSRYDFEPPNGSGSSCNRQR